jgi:hypothetical protein
MKYPTADDRGVDSFIRKYLHGSNLQKKIIAELWRCQFAWSCYLAGVGSKLS